MATTTPITSPYSDDFYERISGRESSGSVVLGELCKFYQPKSIADFGCGQGAWLAAAGALGCERLIGFDGPWVNLKKLADPRIEFFPMNFEGAFPTDIPRVDLALSVEVAEHISPSRARDFISLLCSASDVIIFGAAASHQGGIHHVNEQPASYWIRHFSALGYECFDVFRGALWDDRRVEWWYRQNTLLFVHRDCAVIDRAALLSLVKPITDVIHPEALAHKAGELVRERSYRSSMRGILDAVRDLVRSKLRARNSP